MVRDWYRYVSLSEFHNHRFWSTLTTETTGCTFRQLYKRKSKQTKISQSYFRMQRDNLKENFPQNYCATQITYSGNKRDTYLDSCFQSIAQTPPQTPSVHKRHRHKPVPDWYRTFASFWYLFRTWPNTAPNCSIQYNHRSLKSKTNFKRGFRGLNTRSNIADICLFYRFSPWKFPGDARLLYEYKWILQIYWNKFIDFQHFSSI